VKLDIKASDAQIVMRNEMQLIRYDALVKGYVKSECAMYYCSFCCVLLLFFLSNTLLLFPDSLSHITAVFSILVILPPKTALIYTQHKLNISEVLRD
jgi:hypothetical protein